MTKTVFVLYSRVFDGAFIAQEGYFCVGMVCVAHTSKQELVRRIRW